MKPLFVSYNYLDDTRSLKGFGHCEIGYTKPVSGLKEIRELTALIESTQHVSGVIILTFQRME